MARRWETSRAPAAHQEAVRTAKGLTGADGSFSTYRVEKFSPEAHERLVGQFNAARDEEYAEVVERAAALVHELDREAARGKYTFAEVDENDAELAKLRRWLDTIGARDRFRADGREGAWRAVDEAAEALRVFTGRSAGTAPADHDGRDRRPGGER